MLLYYISLSLKINLLFLKLGCLTVKDMLSFDWQQLFLYQWHIEWGCIEIYSKLDLIKYDIYLKQNGISFLVYMTKDYLIPLDEQVSISSFFLLPIVLYWMNILGISLCISSSIYMSEIPFDEYLDLWIPIYSVVYRDNLLPCIIRVTTS